MKTGPGSIAKRNQLQWMALLTAAVVLPTVSLLWFMSRAVINERLVIEQKLTALYSQRLEDAGDQVKDRINERLHVLNQVNGSLDPYGLLQRLVLTEGFQGVVIWKQDGSLAYPTTDESFDSNDLPSSALLSDAWRLEFTEQDFAAAAELYGRLAATDPQALAGQIRCLARLDRWSEAMDVAVAPPESAAAPARLLLLSLLQKSEPTETRREWEERLVHALNDDLFKSDSGGTISADFAATRGALPAEQNLFIARRLRNIVQEMDGFAQPALVERLGLLMEGETRSIAAAETFPSPPGAADTIVPVQIGGESLYAMRHPSPIAGDMLIVMSSEGLASALDGYHEAFDGSEVHYRILDPQGARIAGEPGDDIPAILTAPLPVGFPRGTIELFFADGDMFNKAAERQITIYVWTGVLVIVLMLVVGAFAGQAVGRQIRLNKMKNNFIATVSHELKTPLASMRLLVDTLREGRTRDETHANEYLQMIARENERLTRMIENFLSFSRMERNKNAFTIAPTSPVEIVEGAIDSICTKYRTNQCQLETELADDLPEIAVDHDAIVTVLINLLDNACKYTTDHKQIRLSVFAEGGDVCFVISDNGLGMSRRQVRRIFDSFYQADNSLARAAEGCGLGLSIVQFIVNAHKGRVEVDSQLGEGSTFTVRLPMDRSFWAERGSGRDHGNRIDCRR